MCCDNREQLLDQLNPTFLFTWKGTRLKDEARYHSHDFIEMAFILSGHGKYKIADRLYDVSEGDIIILNPGQKHQALCTDPANPTMEFFVGLCDVRFPDFPENYLPLHLKDLTSDPATQSPILHTSGELRQKLFKICTAMSVENDVCRSGRYIMLKSYLMQMLILLLREQSEPVKINTGCSFESTSKKYVVDQIVNYFEDHYSEKISLDQIAENMYLSPFYISRIFKSETGDTPIRHLINIRLEKQKNCWKTALTAASRKLQPKSAMMMSIISASCLKNDSECRRQRSVNYYDSFKNFSRNLSSLRIPVPCHSGIFY